MTARHWLSVTRSDAALIYMSPTGVGTVTRDKKSIGIVSARPTAYARDDTDWSYD